MNFENIDWKSLVVEYGTGLAKAIAVILIGFWIAKMIGSIVKRMTSKGDMDASLQTFFVSMVTTIVKILVVISALGMLGVEMTSFIAILGAAGLAIGMALSGTLQNFAGGVMLLLFRPFKIGDLIHAQNHTGVVKEQQLFVTTLLSPESKTIILPNGPLSNGDITNFTTEGKIRVDLAMGIGYGESISKAKEVLMKVMVDHPKVIADPAPFVGVSGHGGSSVDLAVRPHCDPAHYWDVYFDIYEQGKNALDAAGIEIPFPQQVNHQA